MGLIQDISTGVFAGQDAASITAVLVLAGLAIPIAYRLTAHPLSHIPGPFLARATSLFIYAICYLGIEGRVLRYYHLKYNTKVLRVGPNSVSVSDSDAIRDIYIAGGGFRKDHRYKNFNLGPIVSIFSSRDTEYRDVRAKAVAPLFAPVRLRAASQNTGVIGKCVADFISHFRDFREKGIKVDIVDLCARLSIDVVTGYLLGERYGGFDEYAHISIDDRQHVKLSANPFIFAIVAFSRFSLLPNWLFRRLYAMSTWLSSNEEVAQSFIKLDRFAEKIMGNALAAEDRTDSTLPTYQMNLLHAGISPIETSAQSKAIVFAGADSTAVMLATIVFHLTQNPAVHEQLLQEIREAQSHARRKGDDSSNFDPQTLPYLRAVIKEGLRLGMANPTRLTRIVPAGGLLVGNVHIPGGTVVGCAAYTLHHDPDVFPEPFAFQPQRWLEGGKDQGLRRPEMERSLMPFGAGLRACIGKNLAQQQLYQATTALVDSEMLSGAQTCQRRIELVEWFNGEIKGHQLEIEWVR